MSGASPHPDATDRAAEATVWSVRLAEGPLSDADGVDFQRWLEDPENAAAMDEIVGAWRAVENYAAAPEMLALRRSALASAQRAHRSRHMRPAHGGRWRWGALAASLALAVLFAGAWRVVAPHAYETGLGERRIVALSDGSHMSLDAQTKVLVRYAFGRRSLWLERGRAKFDVAKDPLHPFSVEAGGREVVATGTSFSVELARHQVRVILYEGRLAVLDHKHGDKPQMVAIGAANATADRALTPDHELIARTDDSGGATASLIATVAPVDPVRSLSWEGGQLVFEDEPLPLAVERMDRYASTPMTVGDPAAARVRISGVFRAGDVDSFVQGLTAAFPVKARERDGRIVLDGTPVSQNRPNEVRVRRARP
ncbi:MAG TPA: FecR domain-containing protein [Caulobacteraceae bacterium]|jgi:transmembrane sensor|nr:FecR domain-containing protein [Caulobacteraceae bacterium]